jgi:hypothetical protein
MSGQYETEGIASPRAKAHRGAAMLTLVRCGFRTATNTIGDMPDAGGVVVFQ